MNASANARRGSASAVKGEWLSSLIVHATVVFAVLALVLPIGHIVFHGAPMLTPGFLLEGPAQGGRAGGIGPILVSTAMIVGISLAASLPIALGTAILLSEFLRGSKVVVPIVKCSLDILAGVPSVVFGLFGLAFFCRWMGLGYSILAGGLTLGCMILPILTRTFCSAIDQISSHYRTAAIALGLNRTATVWHLTLPVAIRGLTAGLVLGLTRALAETAVLLFTSGYADRMPESVLDSGRSVSVHIYELATNVPGGQHAAYGSAFVLLLLLALISLAIHFTSDRLQAKLLGTSLSIGR